MLVNKAMIAYPRTNLKSLSGFLVGAYPSGASNSLLIDPHANIRIRPIKKLVSNKTI
jgi:hypothetical protein